ncbi:PD-(D/E)XK nuclease family protein [Streptosporangium sp. NPDC002721]|uniref:PD-(D/E)XK nuclease family protein n=1 Tax=Streptosporangium sp. NPDC002721 TaxID=3366188 RepID=UPI00369ECC11
MTVWLPPPGTTGDGSAVRTGLPVTREDPRDCPTAVAAGARIWLRATPEPPRRRDPLQSFTLKPFMDALDLIEHRGVPTAQAMAELHRTQGTFSGKGRPPAHPGLIEWTAAAVPRYLAAREAENASGTARTYPVPEEWVVRRDLRSPDRRGAAHYEQTAWGRRYVSADGGVRELRLLSFGTAKKERSNAERAAAAHTAAFGFPSASGYGELYRPVRGLPAARTARPRRVRVVDVGCGDGSSTVLADWDLEETLRRYAEHTVPALGRAVDATGHVPGSGCVGCKALNGCTTLHQAPGMLGLAADLSRPRRSVSASDLRTHLECPARFHLTRQLKLRSPRPENAAILRGRAVDAWLNERHATRPLTGCGHSPGPENPGDWSAGGHVLTGEEAEAGARMIAEHAALCPLDGLDPGERVRVQPQLTCYDPELDVVVIATPDLLHTREGGWIWRETKTAGRHLWEERALMRTYPQLALAVLMMASGVLGGDMRRSRVELEMLYPDDGGLEVLDPGLPSVVDEARAVIAEMAGPWQRDTSYSPVPGRHCGGCEALDWCRPGREHLAPSPDPAT